MNIADTLIHVEETLGLKERETLAESIREIPGVIAPRFNQGQDHLLLVAFDPAGIQSNDLLNSVRNKGYHAQLVAL